MANEVRIHTAVTGNATKEIKGIDDAWTNFKRNGVQGLQIGAGIAATNLAFSALDRAISGTIGFLGDSVAAAQDEEVGLRRLDAALRANVAGWDGNTSAIEDTIAAREKLAFTDGEQRDALALLVARTHDVTKALDLERTAMDLARLKGVDLATASELVGKVYGGNIGVLTRYGIAIDKGASATEAIAKIQEMAAGQAEEYGNSAAGAAESARIAMEDLQEEIGQGLLPVQRDLSLWVRDEGIPALSGLVKLLGTTGEAMDSTSERTRSFREEAQQTGIFWKLTGMQIAGGLEHIDGASKAAADSILDFRAAERDSAAAGKGLAGAAGKAADGLDDAGDEAVDTTKAFKRLQDAAHDVLDSFLDSALGPKELKLQIREQKLELKDNIDRLHDLERIKDPTRDQRKDIIDTKLAIIDNKREVIKDTSALEEMGKVPMGSTRAQVNSLLGPLNEVERQAWETYAALKAVGNLGGGGGGGGGGGDGGGGGSGEKSGRATGGYSPAGSQIIAGETGVPETIDVLPGGGVMVHPLDGRGAYGTPLPSMGRGQVSGSMTAEVMAPVVIHLDGRVVGEGVAPVVVRWAQDRMLIGA